MLKNSSSVQDFFITRSFQGIMGKTWGITESISRYFALGKENRALAEEVFELNRKIIRLNQALEEAKLDSMLTEDNALSTDKFIYMPAAITKNSLNKQHNYLIINKGSADGVRPQSGVITPEGVVGIVESVSRHYSYVISFLNSELSISARIGDSGAAGPMVWDGRSTSGALLKEIPLQYKFEPGDTVYTSGYSSIFPPDIPLGTTGETKVVNGATYEVRIELFQNFPALRYVTIVSNKDIIEIEELEKGETHKKR